MPETAQSEPSSAQAGTSSGGGATTTNLAYLVPSYNPSTDDLVVWSQKVELLAGAWPEEKMSELIARLILGCSGSAFAKLQQHQTSLMAGGKSSVKKIVEMLGGYWGRIPLERKYEYVEKALFRSQQKTDESNDSYLARMDVVWTEMTSRVLSMEELQAYVLLRGSQLQAEDKKRVILECDAKKGSLEVSQVSAAIRMLGAGFFQEMTGGKRTSRKTYDGSAFLAEDEEIEETDTAYQAVTMEEWEDETVEAMMAEGDDDAQMILDFETAATEILQNDPELASAFTAYTDARRRLSEKARFRGFWPVQKQSFSKGKRKDGKGFGKGKSFGKKTLQQKILNSHCRLCGQKGHWRAECPQRPTNAGTSTNPPTTGAFTGMSAAVTSEDILPMEFMSLPEEFQPSEEPRKEPCPLSMCFMGTSETLWGKHSAKERIKRIMMHWGVAQPRATGFWVNDHLGDTGKGQTCESHNSLPRHRPREMPSESNQKSHMQAKPCINPYSPIALTADSSESEAISSGAFGILDTGATKTVMGSKLIREFLTALSPELRAQVSRGPCNVMFRFGNQGTLMSHQAMIVPLGPLKLRIAIVPGQTPLLLSNTLMRVLKASIDMDTNQLKSPHLTVPVDLMLSPRGLYMISVDDLARSVNASQCTEGVTYRVETADPSLGKTPDRSVRTQQVEQPEGSSAPVSSAHHGRSREADERPGAAGGRDGDRADDPGRAGPDQGQDREDLQRVHVRRDVAQSQVLGQVDAEGLRGIREAAAQDAPSLRATQAAAGGGEPEDLCAHASQEQERCSSTLSREGGTRGAELQHGDGGRDGGLGDGRGRGQAGGDPAHPERDGPPVRPHGQHGEHVVADPHADPVPAAEPGEPWDRGSLESSLALICAGDMDALEPERTSDVSGHDMQLLQRLLSKYAQEIRQFQTEVLPGAMTAFMFEVFCGSSSQLVNQCHVAQVPAQRFTRERNDLETAVGRRELFREMIRHQPTHIWFAPTCTVWSGWSSLNGSKSMKAYEQLITDRVKMLHQIALGIILLRFQRHHGRHMHWEQPRNSLMNRLACLREVRQLCHQANFDMCVTGDLRCPATRLPMKKSTTVFTTHEPLHAMLHQKMCYQHPQHQVIEGSIVVDGLRINRSQFSERYTRRFARKVIQSLLHDKPIPRQDPGWALAGDGVDEVPPAKRIKVGHDRIRVGGRPAPTSVQRLDEPKRQRLEGKQPAPVTSKVKDIVRRVHEQTPRVGKIEIRDLETLSMVQELLPDRQIRLVVACRGTDRTIGPPETLSPQEAPWRRAVMVRRHDGAIIMETDWEDWSRLPKSRRVRTNHACKLNITVFGQVMEPIGSERSEESERIDCPDSAVDTEVPPVVVERQQAGCSLERVRAEVEDPRQGWAFKQLSVGERQWLAKIHKNLGHPHAERLAATLRDQGYQPRLVEAARQFQCSSCQEGRHASAARPATLRDPIDFNDRVSMDAIIVSTRSGQQFRIYHLVDHGTSYQTAFVTSNGSTDRVIEGMTHAWLTWAGPPGELCVDAGKELNSEAFQQFLQSHNIKGRTIAVRAHWQNGRAERHGAVLQHMLDRYDQEQPIQTHEDMQQALWAVTHAKNSLSIRRGYSPEILVLGKATRLPGSVVSDVSLPAHLLAESEEAHGVAFRQNLHRREVARKAFHEADNAAALRRAALRQSRPDRSQYAAGEWIMMLVQKGNIPNQAEWIGPLKVLLQSDQHVVWASGSDRLYKAAPEHCRPVSAMEARQIPRQTSSALDPHEEPRPPPIDADEFPPVDSAEPSPNPEFQDHTSVETVSQPDEEPSRQATEQGAGSSTLPSSSLAEQTPVPVTDDELFSDGACVFSCDSVAPLAWRTEVVISEKDLDAWRQETNPHEMAFMAAASKKQHSEVKLSELTVAEQELFAQAKASEIQNWLSNKAVEKVLRSQIPADQVLRCRWILTWKAIDPSEVTNPMKTHKPKARLVVLGYLDPDLENIPRDSPTLSRNSRMLILQLIASQAWKLQSFDIKAAFLQGQPQDSRIMGLEPTEEFRAQFNMKPDQILRLVKGAYGLVDAPFLWYQALRAELLRLGLEEAPWDPTVFIMRDPESRRPKGIIGMHVDDGLCGGDEDFEVLLKKLEQRYAFGSHKVGTFTYTGIELSQKADGSIVMSQSAYVRAISPIKITADRRAKFDDPITDSERHRLRALIGSLQYAAVNTRPDLCSRLGALQSAVPRATVETLTGANKVLHEAKAHHDVCITMQPIPTLDVRFLAFCDASFASPKCPDSHAGSMIMCAHKSVAKNVTSAISPISWSSRKIHKVVTSTLSAETMSLNMTLDQLSWLKLYWAWILDNRVAWRSPHEALKHVPQSLAMATVKDPEPHIAATDCKSLFDLITRTAMPSCSEFRTQLHARAIRDLISEGIQMRWVHSGAQVADALTKVMPAHFLRETLRLGRYQLSDEQSILKQRADNRRRVQWLHEASSTSTDPSLKV